MYDDDWTDWGGDEKYRGNQWGEFIPSDKAKEEITLFVNHLMTVYAQNHMVGKNPHHCRTDNMPQAKAYKDRGEIQAESLCWLVSAEKVVIVDGVVKPNVHTEECDNGMIQIVFDY